MNNRGDNPVLARLLDRGRKERLPLHGSIELTRRCNLDCPYCYLRFDHGVSPDNELSIRELLGLFDQFAAEGCLFLTFTGGEPLLREDFREIYLGAIRKGLITAVFTNGALIDADTVDFFARYPPLQIDITIFGSTAETADRVAGRKGSFARVREAISLLEERKIPFGLKTVVSTLNRGELREMKEFARRRGKILRFDGLITPQLNGSRENLRYRLDPEEVIRLDREDAAKWREWTEYACRQGKIPDRGLLYGCGGGLHSFHVSAEGKLSLCVLDTNHRFDLRKGAFREGWREFIPRVRAIRTGPGNPCGGCDLRPLCTSCPAWARLEAGDPEKPVDFLCQIARQRAILKREEAEKTLSQA